MTSSGWPSAGRLPGRARAPRLALRLAAPLLAALLVGGLAGTAAAQVPMRLGKVKGPGWSRARAAVQVALERREEVRVVRSGEAGRIGGRIRKGGRGYLADLYVIAASGERAGKARFSGVDRRALANDIKERLWSQLGREVLALAPEAVPAPTPPDDGLPAGEAPARRPPPPAKAERRPAPRKAAPPPASENRALPPPAPENRASPPAASARRPAGGRSSVPSSLGAETLRFSFGAGIYSRELSWVDDLFRRLAGYSLGAAPVFRFGAEWYPGAHFSAGPAGWVGLDVEAELPFGVESNREGVVFPTAASAWRLGLVGRLPIDALELRLGVGLAERRFAIEVSEDGFVIPDLPEVRYQTLSTRLAVTVRLLERLDLSAYGGWGFMLDAGAIGRSRWFPRSSSHTASAGGQVGVQIANGVGVVGRFDWQGAFFDLQPEPGDARVAGGASDNYYAGTVGLSYAAGP